MSVYDPVLPDFLGGLVAPVGNSIVRYDGMTGQTSTLYTAATGTLFDSVVPHPDGTIFALVNGTVMGIDPTGAVKVSVSETPSADPSGIFTEAPFGGDLIIAGDAYAYHPYTIADTPQVGGCRTYHLMLLRANSSGASDNIKIVDQHTCGVIDFEIINVSMITNADQGIVLTWDGGGNPSTGMAVTTGTSMSPVNYPSGPNGGLVVPVLQAQDGSFIGTVDDGQYQSNLIAFDQAGNLRWSVPGNWGPQIATADGGVIATDDSGAVITFDQNGSATGQLVSLLTQSWRGNSYEDGIVDRILNPLIDWATTTWAHKMGSPSSNGTAARPWYFGVRFSNDFTFTPLIRNNPASALTVDISNRATLIKIAAVTALKDAFYSFPVIAIEVPETVFPGQQGDVVAVVLNHDDIGNPGDCGASQIVNSGKWVHEADYARNMTEAQPAFQIVINNATDETTVLATRLDMLQGIGRGLGVTSAHEIAHQFVDRPPMDNDPNTDFAARGTYNATGCNGGNDPSPWIGYWPAGLGVPNNIPLNNIPLHWEPPALSALIVALQAGWHQLPHN